MNEKIKEFAEQAWPGLPSHWWDRRDGEVAEAVNKFAELIVKECVQEVEGMAILMDAGHDQWNRAIGHTALHLKEHFGVAE
jgi:hypothetical protein